MATKEGYICCIYCESTATVYKAEGKRKDLYIKCPECGTDQSNGTVRQAYIKENMRDKRDVEDTPDTAPDTAPDTVQYTVQDIHWGLVFGGVLSFLGAIALKLRG